MDKHHNSLTSLKAQVADFGLLPRADAQEKAQETSGHGTLHNSLAKNGAPGQITTIPQLDKREPPPKDLPNWCGEALDAGEVWKLKADPRIKAVLMGGCFPLKGEPPPQ